VTSLWELANVSSNWLLDLLLQGYEYKADKASLAREEAGLAHEFLHLAEEHANYFHSGKRVQALKELIGKDDQSREIRLKMMAVLAGTAVEIDALLLGFLGGNVEAELIDPVTECLDSAALVNPFWKEVEHLFAYAASKPSIRDFVVTLFRGADPLDDKVPLPAHSRVFLQRWKDSQTHRSSFQQWSARLERELHVAHRLDAKGDKHDLGEADAFEIFEKFTIHRLCRAFEDGSAAEVLRQTIQARRQSFWYGHHEDGYLAILHAIELRERLARAELTVDSIETGLERYQATWWRIDQAYRLCCLHLRRYGQVNVMEQLEAWIGKSYVNNFLLPLADRWSDRVRFMDKWSCASLHAQRDFVIDHVLPFLHKGQKIFVIISDALRYEAAADLADRINSENRFTAEVSAMFGELNGSNMLLTADHGFLFQLDDVHDGDATALPQAAEWKNRNRRFAIGFGIQESSAVKVFTARQLSLPGEWSCAFPLSLGRFPLQGSGKRYVHGGFSLQEVVIPVVRINKSRTDDTGRVTVEFMRVPAKITTGQVAFSLFQEKPVTAKRLPRELRVGIYAPDGASLSEVKTYRLDSKDEEARTRETSVILTLSASADAFNNTTLEIRLDETLPGTNQTVTYKSHAIKLQKPFASDFDDL